VVAITTGYRVIGENGDLIGYKPGCKFIFKK
jgi:O6-methylguanine-DNA--protein-cysteine methyltransferase